MNLKHFIERAQGSGDVYDANMNEAQFRKILTAKINSVDMEKIKADAIRFIPDGTQLAIWSKKYFSDLSAHLKME